MKIYQWIILFLLILPVAIAHVSEEHTDNGYAAEGEGYGFHMGDPYDIEGWPSQIAVLKYASLICGLLIFYAVVKKKLKEKEKKFLFWSIVVVVAGATLYLMIFTLHITIISESKGLIHWHADFELWMCGEKQTLPGPDFPSNKVGTRVLHHHDDYRMHIEGIVLKLQTMDLAHFFHAIGGDLTQDRIGIPQEDGTITYWTNGDYCPDGSQGTLRVYVQKKFETEWQELENFSTYVISPYQDVPPGDRLEFRFE